MKKNHWWKGLISIWAVVGGLVMAALLIGAVILGLNAFRAKPTRPGVPTAVQTILPAPTYTPVVVIPTPNYTQTPTAMSVPPSNDAVTVGAYVQVIGTGGVGLRLRSEPSTSSSLVMVGLDSEVFEVKDGPRQSDGFTWWRLVNPYDTSKGGWAVSNYLTVIQKP